MRNLTSFTIILSLALAGCSITNSNGPIGVVITEQPNFAEGEKAELVKHDGVTVSGRSCERPDLRKKAYEAALADYKKQYSLEAYGLADVMTLEKETNFSVCYRVEGVPLIKEKDLQTAKAQSASVSSSSVSSESVPTNAL